MTAGGGQPRTTGAITGRSRRASPLLPAILAAALAVLSLPGSALAQEGGLFGRLFGSQPRRYIDPPQDGGNAYPPPRYYIDPPARPRPRKASPPKPERGDARKAAPGTAARSGAAAVAKAPEPVAKAPDAKVVLVVGDFMALSLAKGLEASVADDASVRIANRTDGSSGLVRDDHFDWPERIGAIIDDEKPAVVAVMLGSNDRQAIRGGGMSEELRSDDWTAEYTRRMDALSKAVADKKLPLVWVGLPAFKSARMSDDVAYFNELYRQAATAVGGEFVDVWDGFVDANGAFASNGPDVAGQPARLRNSDGITMTPQGGAKLAFFAEKALEKFIGKTLEGVASAQPEAEKAVPQNPANATSVPAVALASPSLDGGDTLLGLSPPRVDPAQPSPREKLVALGAPPPAAAGRADDFAWDAKTGPVGPALPAIVSRGTVDLGAIRAGTDRPAPPRPMPSLQDAIIDDWKAQSDGPDGAEAPNAKAAEPARPASP